MTNKKVAELDAEFIEYKAEAKASMDALEKKIDDGEEEADMTNRKVAELDVEFAEYKEEASGRMDALEKKFDKGIGKLDERIGTIDQKFDEKFKELKQLILGRAPTQTETSKPPIKTNVYVPPPRLNETARRTYDDLGFPFPKLHAEPSTAIGKN
ncbi:hypothetical protein Tco_1495800 [Tanacetum coccineum]